MPKLLALFKIADDRNLRTSFVLTFLSSKRREPSIGWKNIAFPWHGSAPAAFVFLLTNDPIRHYSPDIRGRTTDPAAGNSSHFLYHIVGSTADALRASPRCVS